MAKDSTHTNQTSLSTRPLSDSICQKPRKAWGVWSNLECSQRPGRSAYRSWQLWKLVDGYDMLCRHTGYYCCHEKRKSRPLGRMQVMGCRLGHPLTSAMLCALDANQTTSRQGHSRGRNCTEWLDLHNCKAPKTHGRSCSRQPLQLPWPTPCSSTDFKGRRCNFHAPGSEG